MSHQGFLQDILSNRFNNEFQLAEDTLNRSTGKGNNCKKTGSSEKIGQLGGFGTPPFPDPARLLNTIILPCPTPIPLRVNLGFPLEICIVLGSSLNL
jgi:hypothetical protein